MPGSETLFRPFSCRGMTLRNRVIMAPMTRTSSPGGVPSADMTAYYVRRAKAQVGLIITEGTTIDRPAASSEINIPNFHTPQALSAWQRVFRDVHAQGGKIAPQLWHMGMMRKPGQGPYPEAISDSPSGLTHKGKQVFPTPTDADIENIITAFVKAAKQAQMIGADCIEFHGAHGYLIDQFFWPVMNTRIDKYGGSLEKNARFAAEVISRTRQAVGADMPILLRISQWKQQDFNYKIAQTPQQLERFLGVFVEAGVDILDCSTRRFWEPEFAGSDLNLAGWAKKLTGLASISVGSVGLSADYISGLYTGEVAQKRRLDDLFERLERNEFDLIAVGRALLQDPFWLEKIRDARWDDLLDYTKAAEDTVY